MIGSAENPDVILIDGSSYLYRAFHALPPLATGDGRPTGAIKGVVSMVRKLLNDHAARIVAVVFDAPGPTFRHEMYAEYKANRESMPDELRSQVEPLHALIRALGIPLVCVAGVEADDVIGTLVSRAREAGLFTLVSTGDKDLAQLVDPHCALINTMNNLLLDVPGVEQKFGVAPEQIVDYLSLIGDSSDNIPGVSKVGPKTAVKWLAEHGSLDTIMATADTFKGKVGENLRAALEQLPLSRELVRIRCDLELEVALEELIPGAADTAALRELYRDLEFRTWLAELNNGAEDAADAPDPAAGSAPAPPNPLATEVVDTLAALDDWLARIAKAPILSFDLETTSLNYMDAAVVGISLAVEPGNAAYIPVGHTYEGAPAQLDWATVRDRLAPVLEDPAVPKVGQNLKYDINVLACHGVEVQGVAHDSMLQSYVIDSTAGRHDLDSLAGRLLGRETIHFEDVAGKGVKQITFDQVPIEQAAPYAGEDAEVALCLHHVQWPKLEAEPGLLGVYRDIEIPLVPILSRMERAGALVDPDILRQQSAEISERLQELETEAHTAAGGEFNLSSPKQLQEILFERQGLPQRHKTPGGKPSTAENVLQELADEGHELPQLILEHRGLAKLRNTYTERLPEQINARTGRLHTSYHQAVAATGRLSSSDPNLQNIPIRTAAGRRVRQAFVAPPGKILLSADYSQIELRIMAHLSADPNLCAALSGGEDVHKATAAEVFRVSLEDVSSDDRRVAKAINFGLIYGMSAFGLARQLGGIPRYQAQAYIDRYFERYPGVRDYMDHTRERARQTGCVETLFGRRLYLREITARNPARRQGAERAAINAPMQGTAADIIKRAMLAVDLWIRTEQPPVVMIMQVHDELVFEIETSALDACRAEILQRMSAAADLSVPLLVEAGSGPNWDAAH